ncbi:unnamed protein product [Notodromas monacha]|uniref:MRH domain-containing protein n=1 Tax=Notodromas monacha TaxID=399045 RepID=A0A7R9BF98_9CRUS|nr:unnamed protein product [Notodromas monacha]CAG0913583.1 unnamed protein product [Notodromas monacha]
MLGVNEPVDTVETGKTNSDGGEQNAAPKNEKHSIVLDDGDIAAQKETSVDKLISSKDDSKPVEAEKEGEMKNGTSNGILKSEAEDEHEHPPTVVAETPIVEEVKLVEDEAKQLDEPLPKVSPVTSQEAAQTTSPESGGNGDEVPATTGTSNAVIEEEKAEAVVTVVAPEAELSSSADAQPEKKEVSMEEKKDEKKHPETSDAEVESPKKRGRRPGKAKEKGVRRKNCNFEALWRRMCLWGLLLVIRSDLTMLRFRIGTEVFLLFVYAYIYDRAFGHDCSKDGYHFVFTECDDMSKRWRVAVPNSESCKLPGAIKQSPILLPDCSLTCNPGYYFDSSNLSCEPCEAGYYSVGDALNFNKWSSVPPEFLQRSEALHASFQTSICDKYDWKPRGDYLQSGVGPCVSALILAVKLTQKGELTFTYQYPDSENVLFVFEAQNELCEYINVDPQNDEHDEMPQKTARGEWRNITVPLSAGPNVLRWKTLGLYDESHPVLIQRIHVSGKLPGHCTFRYFWALALAAIAAIKLFESHSPGVGYISNCSKCPAGTYSAEGASYCEACPENTRSNEGSNACERCLENQFSTPGSAFCVDRPVCLKKDYVESHSPCDEFKQTTIQYEWIQPKICRDDQPGSLRLPQSGLKVPCPPCNPGMEIAARPFGKGTTHCIYCAEGEFSDGLGPCRLCPPSTMPKYGLYINRWTRWPEHVASTCMSVEKDTHVEALLNGREADALWSVLILDVPGFRVQSEGHLSSVATLRFEFELDCQLPCELTFLENLNFSFSWAFQLRYDDADVLANLKNPANDYDGKKLAVVRIFSINVTDTLVGGAAECIPCPEIPTEEKTAQSESSALLRFSAPLQNPRSSCIPCPTGYYVQPETRHPNGSNVGSRCLPCPSDTVLAGSSFQHKIGPESCVKCGPGLFPAPNRQYCMTNCSYTWDGKTFDFSPLSNKPSLATEAKLFTVAGNWYFHLFNVSLCGEPLAVCRNNVSLDADDVALMEESVAGMICRSTIVPDRRKIRSSHDNPAPRSLAIQSISLGDRLVGVTRTPYLGDLRVHEDFLQKPDVPTKDVHFFYKTVGDQNENCPKGRATIITMRCDPSEIKGGKKSFPPSCPASTCDGCTYHILWKTSYACSRCTDSEYMRTTGRIVDVIEDSESADIGQSESCALGPGEDDDDETNFDTPQENLATSFSFKAVSSRSILASAVKLASSIFPRGSTSMKTNACGANSLLFRPIVGCPAQPQEPARTDTPNDETQGSEERRESREKNRRGSSCAGIPAASVQRSPSGVPLVFSSVNFACLISLSDKELLLKLPKPPYIGRSKPPSSSEKGLIPALNRVTRKSVYFILPFKMINVLSDLGHPLKPTQKQYFRGAETAIPGSVNSS